MITRDQLVVGRPVKYKGVTDDCKGFITKVELPLFWCSRSRDDIGSYGHCRYNVDHMGTLPDDRYNYPPSWVTPMILKTSLIKECPMIPISPSQIRVGARVKFRGRFGSTYEGFITSVSGDKFWCDQDPTETNGICRYDSTLAGTHPNHADDYPRNWVYPMILKQSLIKE